MDHGMQGVLVLACEQMQDLSGGPMYGRRSLGKQPTLSLLQHQHRPHGRLKQTGRGKPVKKPRRVEGHQSMPTTALKQEVTMHGTMMALGYER